MIQNQVSDFTSAAVQAALLSIEYYVDADEVGLFLKVHRRTILRWARERKIPAHPLTHGKRITWRFKLSEVDEWLSSGVGFLSTSRRPCHQGEIQ